MPDRTHRAVIVFARLPVEGLVKTRLVSSLGSATAATTFYKACAEHSLRQATGCSAGRRVVYHANPGEDAAVQTWVSSCGLEFDTRPQPDVPDLGARMHSALSAELQSADQVVLMGSDIPDVDPAVLNAAFHALDSHQLVLGPACDGGFYLIGATVAPPGFLQGLTWSTDQVLHGTVAHAQALGLDAAPVSLLPRLQDIDTAQDLEAWTASSTGHALLAAGKAALAATAGVNSTRA